MATALAWTGDDEEPVPASFPSSQHRIRGRRTPARPGDLPPDIEAALWRGDEMGSPVTAVLASGFAALDAELPGGGWPCRSLTEVLQVQASVAEWRLLAPAMRQVVAGGRDVVVVGPPKAPAPARPAARRHRRAPAGLGADRDARRAALGHRAADQGQRRRPARVVAAAGPAGADPPPAGVRAGLRGPGLPVPPGSGGTRSLGGAAARPAPLRP